MTYEELEAKYREFIRHERFPDLRREADHFKNHSLLSESDKSWGEWAFNRFFLPYAFDKPVPNGIIHTRNKYTVNVKGYLIDIDTTYAPDFLGKREYLRWLCEAIKV
jgi:hypothetical protein